MRKIIYIMSDVRSGSTLLESIFSNSEGVVSVGELNQLADHLNKGTRGKRWNWKCSCGSSFEDCTFWSKVLKNLNEQGFSKIKHTRFERKSLKVLTLNTQYKRNSDFKSTVLELGKVYESIFKIGQTQVIVDSSKNEHQFKALNENIPLDFNLIYLKRDVRAVSLSKLKWQKKYAQKPINIFLMLIATKIKDIRLRRIFKKTAIHKRIAIEYEDLANNPQNCIDTICSKFDIPKFYVPIYMDRETGHSIGGTPNRVGKRKIELDYSWVEKSKKNIFFHYLGYLLNMI